MFFDKVVKVFPHFCVFSVPVLSTTALQSSKDIFVFDGSSTMHPLINKIMSTAQEYKYNIQNSGTHGGIMKVLDNVNDFALSSQDSDRWSDNDTYKEKWKERKMTTITLAQDAIILLYKKPVGCQDNLVVDKEKFKTIYSLFTNHKFASNMTNNYKSLTDSKDSACDQPIVVFARNGGANKSGTAYSFINSNPLFKDIKDENTEWTKKVLSSEIGTDFDKQYLKFTPENNRLSYENFNFEQVGKKAKMIYLSGTFVLENWKEIEKSGYHIASITKDSETIHLTPANFHAEVAKYGWIRNLNIVYSNKFLKQSKQNLLKHIVMNKGKLSSMFLLPSSIVDIITNTVP